MASCAMNDGIHNEGAIDFFTICGILSTLAFWDVVLIIYFLDLLIIYSINYGCKVSE